MSTIVDNKPELIIHLGQALTPKQDDLRQLHRSKQSFRTFLDWFHFSFRSSRHGNILKTIRINATRNSIKSRSHWLVITQEVQEIGVHIVQT